MECVAYAGEVAAVRWVEASAVVYYAVHAVFVQYGRVFLAKYLGVELWGGDVGAGGDSMDYGGEGNGRFGCHWKSSF
jgi:hypothetical protein